MAELVLETGLEFPRLSDGEQTVTFWRNKNGEVRVDINRGTSSIVIPDELLSSPDALFQGLGGALLNQVFGAERDRLTEAEVQALYDKLQTLSEHGSRDPSRPNLLRADQGPWIEDNSTISRFSRNSDGLLEFNGTALSERASVSPEDFFEELSPLLNKVFGEERDRLTREETDVLFAKVRQEFPVTQDYSELSWWETACAYTNYFCADNSAWVTSFESILKNPNPNLVYFISDDGELLSSGGTAIEPIEVGGVTYDPYTDETQTRFSQEWLDAVREQVVGDSLLELGEAVPFPMLTTLRWNGMDGSRSLVEISVENSRTEVGETGKSMFEFAQDVFSQSEVIPEEYARVLAAGIPAQETNFNNVLVSPADARSAWQILPSTAEYMGGTAEDLNSFETATPIALAYFEYLWNQYEDHPKITAVSDEWTEAQINQHLVLPSVISAYHAGPGRVDNMLEQAQFILELPNETFQRVAVEYARSGVDSGWGARSVTYFPKVGAFAAWLLNES